MMVLETNPEKTMPYRRSSSLSWKMSFSQARQFVFSFIKLDCLIIVLFCICMTIWSEYRTTYFVKTYLIPELGQPAESLISVTPERDAASIVLSSSQNGFSFHTINKNFPVEFGYTRKFSQVPAASSLARSLWKTSAYPCYITYVPNAQGQFWQIMVYWENPIALFKWAMVLLVCIQLLSIPMLVVRLRNRIRKSLQPIYELTATAQTITSPQNTDLSGTIDTLNTITGTQFDRRILVSLEREELKGLAQAINSMLDRLGASYQAQLRFVSDASHELRTPISIIQGYARLLNRWGKEDPKTLQEAIDAIQSEAEGMQILVEQLLFLARSDNQSMQICMVDFDLSDLLGEVIRETEMLTKNHVLVETIPCHVRLVADPKLVKQGVRILIDNSLKYTPENGRIIIALEDTLDEVKIHISDNGQGIAPDDLENLFTRFWRADESRTRKTGGTGLGLSIARWIAEIHGGFITVVSRVNVGSRFTLVFPKSSPVESFSQASEVATSAIPPTSI